MDSQSSTAAVLESASAHKCILVLGYLIDIGLLRSKVIEFCICLEQRENTSKKLKQKEKKAKSKKKLQFSCN